jgi:hypothetical protein
MTENPSQDWGGGTCARSRVEVSEWKYEYLSDAEFEANWIEEHRNHRVTEGAFNWLVCHTCGNPLKLTTRQASAVLREIGRH